MIRWAATAAVCVLLAVCGAVGAGLFRGPASVQAPAVLVTEQERCNRAGGMYVSLPSGKTLCTSPGLFR